MIIELELILTKGLIKDLINIHSILNGAKYFADDGQQSYLVFQPLVRCSTMPTDGDRILAWISIELSKESIKPPNASDKLQTHLILTQN